MKKLAMVKVIGSMLCFCTILLHAPAISGSAVAVEPVATFSIAARDSVSGELGVAVASRFFAVGAVVPWARADVGAVATQSFMNTTFGPRGLDLLAQGVHPGEALQIMLRSDDDPLRRQAGIVAADGQSATYTGTNCLAWAGGRSGRNYAIQGNILTGESVVVAMELAFLHTKGTLADRLYAALAAGDAEGGDSRGKQSAALIVVKTGAGYGGYTDRAIDIRVDDHAEPFLELKRLLDYAQMNYAWNEAWTLFTQKQAEKAIAPLLRALKIAPENPELLYDACVIYNAAAQPQQGLAYLQKAIALNPKLAKQAAVDGDLQGLRDLDDFKKLVAPK